MEAPAMDGGSRMDVNNGSPLPIVADGNRGSFLGADAMRFLEKFELASLAAIDGGRIAVAFEQALRRVASDCDDRPGEKKERVITLQLAVKPRMDVDGLCEDCDVQITVADNVPKRKSKVYNMSLRKGGHLMYAPDSLDDHTQETLDFEDSN